MKAFLLAAGLGTRLKPITDSIPKCLVEINGKPLLFHWLDLLEKENISDVLINTHYFPEKVSDALSSRNNKINIVTTYEETLLGSAGTLWQNKAFVEGQKDFFLLYADNLTNISLSEIYNEHKNSGYAFTVYTYLTDTPEKKGIFKVDEFGNVIEFCEKPSIQIGNIANSGMGVLSSEIFNLWPPGASDFSKDVLTKIINKVKLVHSKYYIKDIGSVNDYYCALEEWNSINR